MALVTLKLEPTAFMTELVALIPEKREGHPAEKHLELIFRLLPHLKNEVGNPLR